ncbi:MAG: TRAP transporter large permease [Treponema sp.]|jgi:C4-dicarboxylate transporter DctM subunit|nr:TRAP transporter large permease [Treponema sp.]
MGLALLILFAILLFIGVPIAVALGLACMFAVGFTGVFPVQNLVQKMFNTSNSFSLMCIPFFILAGNIMASGGVSKRLVNLASVFFGRVNGGLAIVSTVACTFFGAVSGSAPATTAAIGGVMIKPMIERGYDKNFTGAVVAASGIIGLIIPPSLTMVLYGVSTNTSIGDLFIAGIIPGMLICLVLCFIEYFMSKKRGYKGQEKISGREKLLAFKDAVWAILMPVIILGGIYAGIFTPTEAAAVSVAYGLMVGIFIYKEIKWRDLSKVILDAAKSTALIMYLMITADVLSYVLVSQQIPQQLAAFILGLTNSTPVIMIMVIGIMLVAGCFLNNSAAMVLLAPIFYPIVVSLGVNPVFFGIIMVISLAIGHVTPPVGLCLFIATDLGKLKFEELVKEVMPLIIALIGFVMLLSFFPQVVLFLPGLIRR